MPDIPILIGETKQEQKRDEHLVIKVQRPDLQSQPQTPHVDLAISLLPSEIEAYENLKTIAGVQPRPHDFSKYSKGLNFMMRTKYINDYWTREQREQKSLNVFLSEEPPPNEMAISIEMVSVELNKVRSIKEWLKEAALQLLIHADYSRMWDTSRHQIWDSDMTDRQKPFIVRQHRSHVAKKCRRGAGNVIVGTKKAIDSLKLFNNPNEAHFTNQHYRIIEFDEDEIADGNFALIGYAGRSPYDHGLSLALAERNSPLKRGGFGINEKMPIDRWWNRIV